MNISNFTFTNMKYHPIEDSALFYFGIQENGESTLTNITFDSNLHHSSILAIEKNVETLNLNDFHISNASMVGGDALLEISKVKNLNVNKISIQNSSNIGNPRPAIWVHKEQTQSVNLSSITLT